jgi:hypothetical protein
VPDVHERTTISTATDQSPRSSSPGRRSFIARRVAGLFSFLTWLYLAALVAFVLWLTWYLSHQELDLPASVDNGLRDIAGECFGNLYDCLNKPVKQ